MTAQADRVVNGAKTQRGTPEKRAENALVTLVQRPDRLCACGCGQSFTPRTNSQQYLNATHRQRRFVEDKKDATYAFVHALFVVWGRCGEVAAARIAQETVDFYFSARCKALERAGWKYNSEKQVWVYQGAA